MAPIVVLLGFCLVAWRAAFNPRGALMLVAFLMPWQGLDVDFGHGAMTFVQQGHWFRPTALAAAGGFNAANRTCWDAELLVDMALAGVRFTNVPATLGAFRLYGVIGDGI